MELSQFITTLLVINSLLLGTFFGILRNKLIKLEDNNKFYYFFYSLPVIALLVAVIFIFMYFSEIGSNTYAITVLVITGISSSLLIWLTKKYLVIKNIYKSKELDPIINNFTDNADNHYIRLFGGDLDFLGKIPNEMDQHPQYIKLKSMGFRKIEILCSEPQKSADKIRYGKIMHDMPEVELRFYNPEKADLSVRGRMTELHGVKKLLIYIKKQKGIYKTIETDMSDTNGALYDNIWNLVWSLATIPNSDRILEYKNLFRS